MDAAFSAVQLKVAIPRWLCLHQKEGLYQEEKITARISDRSHLIKEKEAKNYNSLWWGGGGQQGGYPSHAPHPPVGGITPKIGGFAVSHHVAQLRVMPRVREWPAKCLRVTREVPASGPPRSHVTNVVGGEKTRFLQMLFN